MLSSVGTEKGRDEDARYPLPSCPESLCPQQLTLPSTPTAQACREPTPSPTAEGRSGMLAGTVDPKASLAPPGEIPSSPQQAIRRSVVMAQADAPPAAIASTPSSPLVATGVSEECFVPLPSCPLVLFP